MVYETGYAMRKLTRQDLLSLEQYAAQRAEFRAEVIAHKRNRHVALGPNVRLIFEDRLTMHYQVQEMLRAERIFEAAGIQDELDAYNPLIPDGDNWKATMQIEYEDAVERQAALVLLHRIEDRVWVQVGEEKVFAIADEDIDRSNQTKTASVHFLRFQLNGALIEKLRNNAALSFGVDHSHYRHVAVVEQEQYAALLADLE
jgi:hypothetical protein